NNARAITTRTSTTRTVPLFSCDNGTQMVGTEPGGGNHAKHVSSWAVWVVGLGIMVDQIDQNIVRGGVDQLKEQFGVGDAAIGVLLSAFVLVNGLVTVPAGYLADRWNRARTIAHPVIGWSLVTMVTAAANTFAT